jgi:tetratricopeptide (TPR) repeat protein
MAHSLRCARVRLAASGAVCLAGVLLLGCGARGASPQLVAEIGKADTLLRAGCYRCLENALAIYERVARSPRAPVGAARGAFAAALLLAVRDKELGIPPETWLERARALAQDPVHATPPSVPAPSVFLDAAALVVGETSGFDPEDRQQHAQTLRATISAGGPQHPARAALSNGVDILADYLKLAVDCQDARLRQALTGDEVLARHGGAPLIRFRLAMCGMASQPPARLRQADSRWVDTLFFEGRAELATRPVADVAKAAELFISAHREFPTSMAITMALGAAQNALNEFGSALAAYDEVLAAKPTHRDALLGRVTSLSYLDRHHDAIESATRMLTLGTWHIGDAYYWRAWNRYRLYELDAAWNDVGEASRLLVNTSVYTLAGFIAYARRELDTAIDRFDRAFAMDSENCEAVWTAGLVHVDQQAWTPAAPKFSRAMSCFITAAAKARGEIAETEKAAYAETLKTRRMAAAQKRLDTAEFRKAQAAFNAAQCYLRLGDRGLALNHVDVAAEHERMKEKAATLKVSIAKLP